MIADLAARYGYFFVALLVTIEGMGVPVPGEIALVTAAAFAAKGNLSIAGVIIAAFVGTLLGGTGGYWIGRTGGIAMVRRYGHWIHLSDAKLDRARRYFDDHGAKTVLVGRFFVLLRILASVLAGVVRMPFGLFTLYNALGGLAWAAAFGTLGYIFGGNLPLLNRYLGNATIAVAAASAVLIAGAVYWRRRGPPNIPN